MNSSDWRREFLMPSTGISSKEFSLRCPRKFQILWMLSVFWLRRIPPTASQLQDHSRETLIGLFTMLTPRDGSSAGLFSVLLLWSPSGSTSQISISQPAPRAQTMRTTWDSRMPSPVKFGRDASGLSLTRCMVTTFLLSRDRLSSIPITQMTQSWTWRVLITPRTHTPQTDTTRDGDKWWTWDSCEPSPCF